MDEQFIGGTYEDADFVIRMKEANIAYYEDECVTYYKGQSTWNNKQAYSIFCSKWKVTHDKIYRLKKESPPCYNLRINQDLKDIDTNKFFLPWSESISNATVLSLVKMFD